MVLIGQPVEGYGGSTAYAGNVTEAARRDSRDLCGDLL
jgi:hypothetical protein